MNRWPTMPVAPRIPTGSLFDMISCDFIPAKFRQGIPPVIRRRIRCAWPPLSRGTQEYDPRCLFDSRSGMYALLRSDYVRTAPEFCYQGMGCDRDRASPPPGRNGAPQRAEAGGIVCRQLPFLSGKREADSAGSSASAGLDGCSVARASGAE